MHHDIKILRTYFDAVESGLKSFEIRFNDRDYKKDDTITLHEIDQGVINDKPTGRTIDATITYITAAYQHQGYVVFAFVRLPNANDDRTPASGVPDHHIVGQD